MCLREVRECSSQAGSLRTWQTQKPAPAVCLLLLTKQASGGRDRSRAQLPAVSPDAGWCTPGIPRSTKQHPQCLQTQNNRGLYSLRIFQRLFVCVLYYKWGGGGVLNT